MKIRITGKGRNRALIDPLTGQKVFLQDHDKKPTGGRSKALQEAIL
jgi:hypothetical protein